MAKKKSASTASNLILSDELIQANLAIDMNDVINIALSRSEEFINR